MSRFSSKAAVALVAAVGMAGCATADTSQEAAPDAVQADPAATGDAWVTLPAPAYPGKRDDIGFVDAQNGWYGTGAGELYRTRDGGDSWTLVKKQEGTFVRAVGFVDENDGFIGNIGTEYYPGVTDETPLYRTRDGGETWQAVDTGDATIKGVCAIDILRTSRVFQGNAVPQTVIHAAGRVGGPTGILRSVDGGESWSVIDMSEHAGMILDVKFFSEFDGLVFASTGRDLASTEGLILRTADGGKTWSEVYRSGRPGELIWKASFPDPRTGYATVMSYDPANAQQVVVKTTDGGASWEELPLVENAQARQFGIGFVDENTGFVGTMAGGFATTDGGASWQPAPIAPAANKFRVVRTDNHVAVFAIGTQVQRRHVPLR